MTQVALPMSSTLNILLKQLHEWQKCIEYKAIITVQPYILFLYHLELSYMAGHFASLSRINAIHEEIQPIIL